MTAVQQDRYFAFLGYIYIKRLSRILKNSVRSDVRLGKKSHDVSG